MAMTRCPNCHKPAILVDARPVGDTYVPEMDAWVPVVERRIHCPPPAGCGTENTVHVEHRVALYRGTSEKRRISQDRPERRTAKRRRSCGQNEVVELPAPRNSVARR